MGGGPTLPPEPSTLQKITRVPKVPMLKPPTLKDNPKIRRQPQQKKKITIQKNKITSMFPAKPDVRTNGDEHMQVQKAVFRRNSQMPESTELKMLRI